MVTNLQSHSQRYDDSSSRVTFAFQKSQLNANFSGISQLNANFSGIPAQR
jgi:hypothetical protein